MKTDKELLELAAKASGMKFSEQDNPLTRDDLALRLAVKLRFEIYFGDDEGEAVFVKVCQENGKPWYVCEYLGDDPLAATRRAIVRAAAEIGETL